MKSVILNMIIVGAISGLIGGEASAISFGFGKSKNKTQQVQQKDSRSTKNEEDSYVKDEEDSYVKKTAKKAKEAAVKAVRKTRDLSETAIRKTKEGLIKTKDSIKTSYKNSKEQRREKALQKGLLEESKPLNTMFVSKSDVEYNAKYLNDVRKSLKNDASSAEKMLSSLENAFVLKSWLFEVSVYMRLCEKFSEQYSEGMNKLKKSKQYDDADYNHAIDFFENAYDIISYEALQKSLINHVQGLISEKNLKCVSIESASNILKKVKKLEETFEQTPETATKLKDIISAIDKQTLDHETSFGYLEKGITDHVRSAEDVMNEIPATLREISKIIQNHIDEIQEQETEI